MDAGAGEERYAEHEPPASLRPFVRTIWTYASPSPSGSVQRIAPDGCPELILDIGSPYEEEGPDGVFRLQPPALFAGQMTRPLALRPVGPIELVAVRFEPDGARDWLGMSGHLAVDQRLDMTGRLAGLTAPAGDPEGQVAVMVALLEAERLNVGWALDPEVRAEIDAAQAEQPPVARPAAEQRALQRRFRGRVGISPREFRSILRFRRVFDHINDPEADAVSWLEAGLAAGYFDQPQMARDFQRYLGCTATAWARDQAELARSIASQTYKPSPHSPL
ncbi:AraC family transcriptional regulator [Brevundimonas goettingensis]|uniref:AraC family transcriptional regulator n=1 Tax=Brevundimonas goettingensis TaxID=2774190 RepID=A0A975BZC6_9CAUL|nr:helix-turn-helix domain-containing protein [Brevundimonas goettingensis]QTC90676.1 AraC family transcriptional regulator [Brevundimonas goettingensis]